MKKAHKLNLSYNLEQIRQKNQADFSRIKKERIDGEHRKEINKQIDIKEKKVYSSCIYRIIGKIFKQVRKRPN